MCPIPGTCDQFVSWTDVRMYRSRISISETACWLLIVFLVPKVALSKAEDAKDSTWCATCSRCLESNAVRCSGIANARPRGDLCRCCASCAVDRKLGESCGSQLSVRPLNIVDSWTAVLATTWCSKGLACIDFVCRNSTSNKEPTILTTRAAIAGVQQTQESRISIEDIGSSDDSSFFGEDDRANFLLGGSVPAAFYRPANLDEVHTTERARSNARFWRKLKTALWKSRQETWADVEASAYPAATNFIADEIDALTSSVAKQIVDDDEMMNDSEIGVALARKKLKVATKTLRSVLPPLEDGTTETMPKSAGVANIKRWKPHAQCASIERSGNLTTITIGHKEFRIVHGTDLMSDLEVLLDAIDHSELDSFRGDLNTVSLLIDSSTDNDFVGDSALSTSLKDQSSHAFRKILKAVEEVRCVPVRQESSTAIVPSATTQDEQNSSSRTVTNVASTVLEGVSTTRVNPAMLQTTIIPSTVFGTASTIDRRLLTPERELKGVFPSRVELPLPARYVASEDARTARTARTTPVTRIPSSTARYKSTEEPETRRNFPSLNFGHVDSSLAKSPKRSRRGLAEIDEDDYETNESVLQFDSLKNVEQLLSHDFEDWKTYEDSATVRAGPGISTRVQSSDHLESEGVSSLYDEVYGQYPEDLVVFFDNDDSQNRSTNSADVGRSLTRVTDSERGSGVTKRMRPLAEKQNVSGDLNAFRAIGNSPTWGDGRSSSGIPANRTPMRATTSPKVGEAQRANATSHAIDDLFNRIETRMDGLERRIEGSVLKLREPLRNQGLQQSHGVQSGRSRVLSQEVERRHEVPINESRMKTLRRAENVSLNGVPGERNRTEIRRFGNRRRMGNHGNDHTKTSLRGDAVLDEEFVADGRQRKRGRLYVRRRASTPWRRPEEERRRLHEEVSAEGVDRLEYPERNGRHHRERSGDRGSRRVARHSIWSPKALRSLPAAMDDDGSKTSRFCGHTQGIPGQGSSDDYPQAPRSLEVLRLESPSTLEAEAFDSKRGTPPPWSLFVSGKDGPDERFKFAEEPSESRGPSSEWPYAVTNRGNSSISIEDAISGAQYEEIAAIHEDDDDFDHLYESVEANDDEDWTMMASVDSRDRIDYFDGIGSHMAPVLLEIYGSTDIPESDESGIHPEFAGMSGRTSRSASENSVSFPNLHSPSDVKRSFSSPTPLVSPQRQKTRDSISRIRNSLSTAEPGSPNAAPHRHTDSSTANFFADASNVQGIHA